MSYNPFAPLQLDTEMSNHLDNQGDELLSPELELAIAELADDDSVELFEEYKATSQALNEMIIANSILSNAEGELKGHENYIVDNAFLAAFNVLGEESTLTFETVSNAKPTENAFSAKDVIKKLKAKLSELGRKVKDTFNHIKTGLRNLNKTIQSLRTEIQKVEDEPELAVPLSHQKDLYVNGTLMGKIADMKTTFGDKGWQEAIAEYDNFAGLMIAYVEAEDEDAAKSAALEAMISALRANKHLPVFGATGLAFRSDIPSMDMATVRQRRKVLGKITPFAVRSKVKAVAFKDKNMVDADVLNELVDGVENMITILDEAISAFNKRVDPINKLIDNSWGQIGHKEFTNERLIVENFYPFILAWTDQIQAGRRFMVSVLSNCNEWLGDLKAQAKKG